MRLAQFASILEKKLSSFTLIEAQKLQSLYPDEIFLRVATEMRFFILESRISFDDLPTISVFYCS